MKKKVNVHYHIILDESASMHSCAKATIKAFNKQIKKIRSLNRKNEKLRYRISLTTFNGSVTPVYRAKKPKEILNLDHDFYDPNGCTALYDAIGHTVAKMQYKLVKRVPGERNKFVVVIITDGEENASATYTGTEVKSTIKELEATGDWIFSFIGDLENVEEIGAELNFRRGNIYQYNKQMPQKAFRHMDNLLYCINDSVSDTGDCDLTKIDLTTQAEKKTDKKELKIDIQGLLKKQLDEHQDLPF